MAVQTIHLIHHTHTDIGYTDHPHTAAQLHTRWLEEAMVLAEAQTRDDASAFRWTCEVFEPVERFLAADPGNAARLAHMVQLGRVEVCAMPFNTTALIGADGWGQILKRLHNLRDFRPRVAMSCDINGLPWGIVPGLLDSGVDAVWMAMNAYSGGTPLPRPDAFWWIGPDSRRILVWNNEGYGDAFDHFHEAHWRRGPVPAVHDVWFHAPSEGDIWPSDPASLQRAHEHLHVRLGRLTAYRWPVLALQVTNQWRMDNDPPCKLLPKFVAAWNAAGLQPALEFSTPSRFLSALRLHLDERVAVLRGDWSDFWVDGSASAPLELSIQRRAKRLLADMPLAAQALAGEVPSGLDTAWATASQFDEHTFGAYESVARPWCPRSLANHYAKMGLATDADEAARILQAGIIRSSPRYCPAAHTRALLVHNPAPVDRSGWAMIGATAMREPAAAVRAPDGQELPLEVVQGTEWANRNAEIVDDLPNDVWPAVTRWYRFRCTLAAGESRRYEILSNAASTCATPMQAWVYQWEQDSARLTQLSYSGASFIDPESPYCFGGLIIETAPPDAREGLAHRDANALAQLDRQQPQATRLAQLPSAFSTRFRCEFTHPAFRRIVQVWDLFPDGEAELTTTLHPIMTEAAQAWYLAFPLPCGEARYEAAGATVRVGHDQMPGTCGEAIGTDGVVSFACPDHVFEIDTDDTPIGVFGEPAARSGRKAHVPAKSGWYALLHHTYWFTNFLVTRFGRLEVRHRLRSRSPGTTATIPGQFWCFPAK